MKRFITIGMAVLALGGATVASAAPAMASDCNGTVLKTVRHCFNVRVAAQHAQIVQLQHSKTVAGLSSQLAQLKSELATLTANFTAVQQRTDCWGNGVNMSEFTTNGSTWGTSGAAGGYPYPFTSSWSYVDVFHQSEPSDQNVYRLITYQC